MALKLLLWKFEKNEHMLSKMLSQQTYVIRSTQGMLLWSMFNFGTARNYLQLKEIVLLKVKAIFIVCQQAHPKIRNHHNVSSKIGCSWIFHVPPKIILARFFWWTYNFPEIKQVSWGGGKVGCHSLDQFIFSVHL